MLCDDLEEWDGVRLEKEFQEVRGHVYTDG